MGLKIFTFEFLLNFRLDLLQVTPFPANRKRSETSLAA